MEYNIYRLKRDGTANWVAERAASSAKEALKEYAQVDYRYYIGRDDSDRFIVIPARPLTPDGEQVLFRLELEPPPPPPAYVVRPAGLG